MTMVISSAVASALASAGTSNNPLIFWDALNSGGGTWSTSTGTEVASATYAGTGTTYDAWTATPNGSNQAALMLDFGSTQSVEFVAIAAHNLADVGASVKVDSSPTGLGGSWTPRSDTETPSDNQAIAFYFSSASARYWRLWITNATGDVSIAVAVFGSPITMAQRIYQGYTPPITQTSVDLQSNVSEGGNLVGSSVVRSGSSASVNFTHLDPATLRGATWKAFQRHFNEGGGFFWAWRPTKYDDLFYAWRMGKTIMPTNSGPQEYMSLAMEMRLYDNP